MYTYKYPHPAVTADAIVLAHDGDGAKLLLIERGGEPYKGRWAFPGGFMNIDETTRAAAARELHEETGIRLPAQAFRQVGAFSRVDRDPRERVITVAYATVIPQPAPVKGGDDAARAQWFALDALPALAFDHEEILQEALRRLADWDKLKELGKGK